MRILVVSPHPDDETLGAGGTLLRMKKEGHQIYWLNVTELLPEDGWSQELIEKDLEQIAKVREYYQFDGFYNLGFPPVKLHNIDESIMIDKIRKVFQEVKPDWLIIPGRCDAHSDHRVVYDCCMACAKTFRAPYIKRIMTMEIISETDYGYMLEKFEPNLYIDISEVMEEKIEAMKLYDTEIEESPFPRNLENIRALAMVRGGGSTRKYAEAFHIVKMIE